MEPLDRETAAKWKVGLVLDQARSCSGARHPGSHVAADALDTARQISSGSTSRILLESRRRLHVDVHHVSAHDDAPPLPRNDRRHCFFCFVFSLSLPHLSNKNGSMWCRFVFMALMEYCLVNIILGDSDAVKPPAAEAPKPEKVFDLAAKVSRRLSLGVASVKRIKTSGNEKEKSCDRETLLLLTLR